MYKKFSDNKILIGSHNKYKVAQLRKYLGSNANTIEIFSPLHLNIPAPPEIGNTFEENCESKAIYYGTASKLITISDDSGICVDALAGSPGVYTADWAVDGDFKPGIMRLKQELNANNSDKYDAKMVSVTSIYWPETNEIHTFRAESTGYVNFEAMNTIGMGFQPIFYPHPYNSPANLLPEEDFNQVNARAKSLKKLLDACF